MATALYIQLLDADDIPYGSPVEFDQKEVTDINIMANQNTVIKRDRKGKPYIFILADSVYYIINTALRFHGLSTYTKLKYLRNNIQKGWGLRVYPKYQVDDNYYFDCIISPEVAFAFFFSGYSKAGDIINLEFIEYTKEGQVIMDDEIIISN